MEFSDEEIARIAHEANRALQNVLGEPCPSEPWDAMPLTVRASMIRAVGGWEPGRTPEEQHVMWLRDRLENGWVHGPVRNEVLKEHPCVEDYSSVTPGNRLKDVLFLAIVGVLRSVHANRTQASPAVDQGTAQAATVGYPHRI